ncbi:MAG: FtsX-like permease family protein [Acidimicrobiia bacterium]|nr:FtsX-like permease family protein [Acidimicrobiia bacterium]
MLFELFVAKRYLMAKRKQAVISIITVISVLGVAAGVMALVIALAINTGFRNTLQKNLLGATAHVVVMEKQPEFGIEDWRSKLASMSNLPGVTRATPALYARVMFTGPLQSAGGFLKGILPPSEAEPPAPLRSLKSGAFHGWAETQGGLPSIILGSHLAHQTGMQVNDIIRVLSPQGEITPFGPRLAEFRFRVTGIFETGFYDLDNTGAFASLASVQRVLAISDVINAIELDVEDIYQAPTIADEAARTGGPQLGATHWMEQNRQLLGALRMEKVVTIITIGLIQLVAALNILTSLMMMVMEKHRDIAIMLSMGTRRHQIGRIFKLQGLIIGVAGTIIGLIAGYTLCFFADRHQWIKLDEAVYSLSFVPFHPRAFDAVWISATALAVSYLATIYPARASTRIAPAEALRYE